MIRRLVASLIALALWVVGGTTGALAGTPDTRTSTAYAYDAATNSSSPTPAPPPRPDHFGGSVHGPADSSAGDPPAVLAIFVAADSESGFVNLASEARARHILDGEVRSNGSFGGGHRPGTGFPNKSEFPSGWSDDKIMHEISDLATDPSLTWRAGNRPGDYFVNGTRDGVDIEVLIRNNEIWTGYPTNMPRNP